MLHTYITPHLIKNTKLTQLTAEDLYINHRCDFHHMVHRSSFEVIVFSTMGFSFLNFFSMRPLYQMFSMLGYSEHYNALNPNQDLFFVPRRNNIHMQAV